MRFKGRHREAFACPRFQIAPAADDRRRPGRAADRDQAHSGWRSLSPRAALKLDTPAERGAIENNTVSGAGDALMHC